MAKKPTAPPPEEPPRKRMVKAPTRGDPAGRNIGERLKTADARSMSSQQWLNRQLNDPFVKQAKARGFRSRAAFKLTEMDDRFHILKRGARVIDLGCAPGGWIQVALERGAGKVVGIDLLPVGALPPAVLIEGDFTAEGMDAQLIDALGGPPDVVLSDMAPNTMGHAKTDHMRIVGLVEMAADFAIRVLPDGGAFAAKAFQGGETEEVFKLLRAHFRDVKAFKPKASRPGSPEIYIVALGKKSV
jgi:23S rRNA (uridine2552-2'-O)-methyltransferase